MLIPPDKVNEYLETIKNSGRNRISEEDKVSMKLLLTKNQYDDVIEFLGSISKCNLKYICRILDIDFDEDLHRSLDVAYDCLIHEYEEVFIK